MRSLSTTVINTTSKTDCKHFNTDDWGGYQRVLPSEQLPFGKDRIQRLERTNCIMRQQTQRWRSRRRQNKFSKVWQQTKVTTRLVVSYFNWFWRHSRFQTTAAQRAGLTTRSWNWHDIVTYPTLV